MMMVLEMVDPGKCHPYIMQLDTTWNSTYRKRHRERRIERRTLNQPRPCSLNTGWKEARAGREGGGSGGSNGGGAIRPCLSKSYRSATGMGLVSPFIACLTLMFLSEVERGSRTFRDVDVEDRTPAQSTRNSIVQTLRSWFATQHSSAPGRRDPPVKFSGPLA